MACNQENLCEIYTDASLITTGAVLLILRIPCFDKYPRREQYNTR